MSMTDERLDAIEATADKDYLEQRDVSYTLHSMVTEDLIPEVRTLREELDRYRDALASIVADTAYADDVKMLRARIYAATKPLIGAENANA